jgi:hypothetical protein
MKAFLEGALCIGELELLNFGFSTRVCAHDNSADGTIRVMSTQSDRSHHSTSSHPPIFFLFFWCVSVYLT